MSTNRYRLGERLTPVEFDDYINSTETHGRHAEDYWTVNEFNLNTDEDRDALEERIMEAYGVEDGCFVLLPGWFCTDNIDVFQEMYRHLKIDFVYDFKTQLFFCDMFGGHECLMGNLFELAHPDACRRTTTAENSEGYIMRGLGSFKSSQSQTIWLGEDVKIPDVLYPYKSVIRRM